MREDAKMNRVYAVVWSGVRQCYVAVSELARRHGKQGRSGGTKRLAAALLVVLALSGAGIQGASAESGTNPLEIKLSEYLKIMPSDGEGKWNGQALRIAPAQIIGMNQNGTYKSSIASVAIGNGATIYGTETSRNNQPGRILGEVASDNVAIGSFSQIGNERAISSRVSERNHGQPEGNIAIGSFAKVSDPTSSNIDEGVAIGMDARVEMSHSVAIGAHAWVRKEDILTASRDGARPDSAFGVFSVGTSANVSELPDREMHPGGVGKYTRRIINVSNGQVNETSNDAINGSQLYRLRDLAVTYVAPDPNGGAIDKSRVELAGTPYDPVNHTGGTTVTNVANGTGDSDAVNVYQLKNAGWQLTANGDNPYLVKKDQTVDVTSGIDNKVAGAPDHRNLIVTKIDREDGTGTGISLQLGDILHIGTGNGAQTVVVDGSRGEITGLTNRTWIPYDYTRRSSISEMDRLEKPINIYENSGRAVTEAQLRQALENLPEGIEFTGNPAGGNGWGKDKYKSAPAQIRGDGDIRSSNSIAMGNGAIIYGKNDTARNPDGYYSENASDNIAIGAFSQVGSEKALHGWNRGQAEGNIAIGVFARVENPTSPNIDEGVAIGMDARVEASNSIALGSHSRVRKEDLLTANKDGAMADSLYGVFSVGNSAGMSSFPDAAAHPGGMGAYNRRIVNVARGQINADSTDAVNGSQLYRLRDLAVKYTAADPNGGPIDKNKVAFEGDPYHHGNHSGGTMVTNVAYAPHGDPTEAGYDGSAAVNMDRLNDSIATAKTEISVSDTHIKDGEYAVSTITGAGGKTVQGVSMDIVDGKGAATGKKVVITDLAKASDLGDVAGIRQDLRNKDGTHTTVVDAINHVSVNIGDIQYRRPDNTVTTIVQAGDNVTNAIGKLDQAIGEARTQAGQHSTVTAGHGISIAEGTNAAGGKNFEARVNDDITFGQGAAHVAVEGTKGNVTATGTVAAATVTAGSVTVNQDGSGVVDGLTNKTWDARQHDRYRHSGKAATEAQLRGAMEGAVRYERNDDGSVNNTHVTLNQGGDAVHVTNVAEGNVAKGSSDAVTGGQLWEIRQQMGQGTESIAHLAGSVNRLGNRMDRVGAGAAALAALHPLDFDPDAKWDVSAGYGNYHGANAVAVGAYYRPNEDVMLSVSGSMGGGENMVNAGISVKLGTGSSNVNNSKVAMAREIKELRKTVEIQAGQIAQLTALVEGLIGRKTEDMAGSRLFPDVPRNHWAYEAVRELAERGYAVGYPDGTFKGDRTLTRYEFAEIIHHALQSGAPNSAAVQALKKEFEPELAYFTVDTIHTDQKGNPTIQRVRVKGDHG